MAISLYQVSVPLFIHNLKALAAILDKGAKHAEAKDIDPSVFLNARLFPDMFALVKQVQIASDTAKGAAARLAGQEPPKYEDNETTFPQLAQRLDKTIAFLQGFKAAQIDGREDSDVTLQMRSGAKVYKAQAYLLGHALPNFFFHCTTAYDILRHNGVEVGKRDFLNLA